jgi:hypothetical protein
MLAAHRGFLGLQWRLLQFPKILMGNLILAKV